MPNVCPNMSDKCDVSVKVCLISLSSLAQVYSCALYTEADRTAKELGVRSRGGFFETDDDYCQALLDGAFSKVLKVSGHTCSTSGQVRVMLSCL